MSMQQAVKADPVFMNGVNVTGVIDTIKAIKADQELARFQFRARNTWVDGGHDRSTIQGFYGCRREDASRTEPFVLDAHEPPVLLGQDTGANPGEFILHALAGCLTTTIMYHAASRGIEIGAVDSTLEGDLDAWRSPLTRSCPSGRQAGAAAGESRAGAGQVLLIGSLARDPRAQR